MDRIVLWRLGSLRPKGLEDEERLGAIVWLKAKRKVQKIFVSQQATLRT